MYIDDVTISHPRRCLQADRAETHLDYRLALGIRMSILVRVETKRRGAFSFD